MNEPNHLDQIPNRNGFKEIKVEPIAIDLASIYPSPRFGKPDRGKNSSSEIANKSSSSDMPKRKKNEINISKNNDIFR